MQNYFSGKFERKGENDASLYLKNYKLFFEVDSGNIRDKDMEELKEKYDNLSFDYQRIQRENSSLKNLINNQ